MAISDNQKVDYLWKKLGYGVAKTDTLEYKRAFNESISSPLLVRGDRVWQRSADIPGTITEAATDATDIITVYDDSGSGATTVECVEDVTASDNRTWKTDLGDWIPPEFGPTYLVKVYVDDSGAGAPQTTGTQLIAAGSGNDDEWFFDYQAGILHFIGENLPTDIATNVTNKVIYVSGARYIGPKGVGAAAGQTADIGDLQVTGTVITTVNENDDLILSAPGPGVISLNGNPLTNVGEPTANSDAATKGYVDNYFADFNDDRIVKDDTTIIINDDGIDSGVIDITIDGVAHSQFNAAGYVIGNTTISSDTVSTSGVLDIDTTAAINLPVGNTAQRPGAPAPGDIRYNTDLATVELYDGNAWVKLTNNIESQIIYPDGSSDTFTLDQEATTDSIMVSLNGVIQSPATYSVLGTDITFVETPLATDTIDVRFLATTVATRLASATAPASATAGGSPGQVAYDSSYIYVCVAQNTWVRAPLSTW
jgi:hypothetical protein